jgi:hypothetical protein
MDAKGSRLSSLNTFTQPTPVCTAELDDTLSVVGGAKKSEISSLLVPPPCTWACEACRDGTFPQASYKPDVLLIAFTCEHLAQFIPAFFCPRSQAQYTCADRYSIALSSNWILISLCKDHFLDTEHMACFSAFCVANFTFSCIHRDGNVSGREG